MSIEALLKEPLILCEGSVVEQLRRGGAPIDPLLVNAPLIYCKSGRAALRAIYESFIALAEQYQLPLLLMTPTWRTNRERVERSAVPVTVNEDAVAFLREIADEWPAVDIRIGGMVGCKGDCYKPQESLPEAEAYDFCKWQAERLAAAGADFLIAETLPELGEAVGIARALAEQPAPYAISFVLSGTGSLLDGTTLDAAIETIDRLPRAPFGYLANCSYPTFLAGDAVTTRVKERFIGFMANGADIPAEELDNAPALVQVPVAQWAADSAALVDRVGAQILGGCCGTSAAHLEAMIQQVRAR